MRRCYCNGKTSPVKCVSPWGRNAVLGLAGDFRSNAVIGHFPAERKPSRKAKNGSWTIHSISSSAPGPSFSHREEGADLRRR
jgi:hypothetical protein